MANPTPSSSMPTKHKEPERLIIRPVPKFVLMYPTFAIALMAAVVPANLVTTETWTLLFLAAFFLNSIVLTFDFNRMTAVAVVAIITVALLVIKIQGWADNILEIFGGWHPNADTSFFRGMSAIFAILFALIAADTRFDYWELKGNEFLHHHGFMGDTERFPATNLTIKKEISDMFEFLMLGSGRLLFFPAGRDRPVILDNVMLINRKEKQIQEMLDSLKVKIETV